MKILKLLHVIWFNNIFVKPYELKISFHKQQMQ